MSPVNRATDRLCSASPRMAEERGELLLRGDAHEIAPFERPVTGWTRADAPTVLVSSTPRICHTPRSCAAVTLTVPLPVRPARVRRNQSASACPEPDRAQASAGTSRKRLAASVQPRRREHEIRAAAREITPLVQVSFVGGGAPGDTRCRETTRHKRRVLAEDDLESRSRCGARADVRLHRDRRVAMPCRTMPRAASAPFKVEGDAVARRAWIGRAAARRRSRRAGASSGGSAAGGAARGTGGRGPPGAGTHGQSFSRAHKYSRTVKPSDRRFCGERQPFVRGCALIGGRSGAAIVTVPS